MKKTRSRNQKILFHILAFALGIIVTLAVCEIVVRIFNLAPGVNRVATDIHRLSHNPDLKYELVPYTYHNYEGINNCGRRDFHYSKEKKKNTFRIAVMGDSVTYGWGTNVWKAHPNVTEYYLNRFQKKPSIQFEVWNFGVRGYGTDEEVAAFKKDALPTDPDLALIAYNLNDPDPYSVDLAWALSKIEWKDEQYLHEVRKSRSNTLRSMLYDRSRFFRFLRYRALSKIQQRERKKAVNRQGQNLVDLEEKYNYKAKKERYFHELTEAFWPAVADALEEFSRVADQNKIKKALAVFPGLDDLIDYHYGAIHQKVADECKKEEIIFFDLLPDYKNAATQWPKRILKIDFNHPNTFGQRIAGWSIAVNLIESGMLPIQKNEYKKELFDFSIVIKRPPLEHFDNQDMFFLEQALNSIFFKHYKTAVDQLEKALTLNPDNALAVKVLKEIYHGSEDDSLRVRIKRLVSGGI